MEYPRSTLYDSNANLTILKHSIRLQVTFFCDTENQKIIQTPECGCGLSVVRGAGAARDYVRVDFYPHFGSTFSRILGTENT